jgi:hypothetical protein
MREYAMQIYRTEDANVHASSDRHFKLKPNPRYQKNDAGRKCLAFNNSDPIYLLQKKKNCLIAVLANPELGKDRPARHDFDSTTESRHEWSSC